MEDFNKEVIKEGAEKVEQGAEKSPETAEQFKSRIDNYFIEFGLDLSTIPEVSTPEKFHEWREKRRVETDQETVTLTDKIIFRTELIYFYVLLSRSEDDAMQITNLLSSSLEGDTYIGLAWDEMDDTQDFLLQAILNKGYTEEQKTEINVLLEKITILSKKLENKDD